MTNFIKDLVIFSLYCIALLVVLIIFAILGEILSGLIKASIDYEISGLTIGFITIGIIGILRIIKDFKNK